MNGAIAGWALAAAALAAGWFSYGWRGVVLAITVIAFWMLLQFSRSVRLLSRAGARPLGHIDNAVMFNARLRPGMRLADAIGIAGSLGRRVGEAPEAYAWRDPAGDEVELEFDAVGRCSRWQLKRSEPPPA